MIKRDFEKRIPCYFKDGKGVILDKKKLNNYELITFILEEIQNILKKTKTLSKTL